MYGTPPPNQRFRPVGFRLTGGGPTATATFTLRPEELTRSEPSQATIQNTLGGAWADSWDRGIQTIRISGTTGWREVGGGGGEAAFQNLRDTSFVAWHARRAALIAAGSDPNAVELVFSDALDGFAVLVMPVNFTLRRSKQRPLLQMYSIELKVLADLAAPVAAADPLLAALAAPLAFATGANALVANSAALINGAGALAGLFG